jgi:hypothetical protein
MLNAYRRCPAKQDAIRPVVDLSDAPIDSMLTGAAPDSPPSAAWAALNQGDYRPELCNKFHRVSATLRFGEVMTSAGSPIRFDPFKHVRRGGARCIQIIGATLYKAGKEGAFAQIIEG